MVPQPGGEPLGVTEQLLDCQRHDHRDRAVRLTGAEDKRGIKESFDFFAD